MTYHSEVAMKDFGEVNRIAAGAIGAPGQRTFWIGVWSPAGVAQLWIEKEQLQALGLAVEEVIEQLAGQGVVGPAEEGEPDTAEPPATTDLELKIGRVALGFDERAKHFLIVVHDEEADPEGQPTLVCRLSIPGARHFSRQIASVIAAGRPRCPLCGGPVNPDGHVCPRRNGHYQLV